MAFNIHPKQITERSNVDKRYRGLINIPGNPFLCWIFEASNSLFHISWVLCSNPSQMTMETPLTLSTASPISPLSLPQSLSLFSFPPSTTPRHLYCSCLPSQSQNSHFLLFLFHLGFAFPTIFAAITFFYSHIFLQPPFAATQRPAGPLSESSSTCQSPTAASKSEVDFLWPLRMWHVARCDSDTWLKMWSAKTNREKVTHA